MFTTRWIRAVAVLAVVALVSAEGTVQGEYIIDADSKNTLEAGDWELGVNYWEVQSNPDLGAGGVGANVVPPNYSLVLLYKGELGPKPGFIYSEEGDYYAPYYHTDFYEEPTDPTAAIISFTGDPNNPLHQMNSTRLYLHVKDGNAVPNNYIFDVTDWWDDRTAEIQLVNFWNKPGDQGAISHVAFYGVTAPIPEPASMLVWGTIGVIFGVGYHYRRRRRA